MTKEEATKIAKKKYPRDLRYHKTEGDYERIDINEKAREEYIRELISQEGGSDE